MLQTVATSFAFSKLANNHSDTQSHCYYLPFTGPSSAIETGVISQDSQFSNM